MFKARLDGTLGNVPDIVSWSGTLLTAGELDLCGPSQSKPLYHSLI